MLHTLTSFFRWRCPAWRPCSATATARPPRVLLLVCTSLAGGCAAHDHGCCDHWPVTLSSHHFRSKHDCLETNIWNIIINQQDLYALSQNDKAGLVIWSGLIHIADIAYCTVCIIYCILYPQLKKTTICIVFLELRSILEQQENILSGLNKSFL